MYVLFLKYDKQDQQGKAAINERSLKPLYDVHVYTDLLNKCTKFLDNLKLSLNETKMHTNDFSQLFVSYIFNFNIRDLKRESAVVFDMTELKLFF
jgi:hypothetical protein